MNYFYAHEDEFTKRAPRTKRPRTADELTYERIDLLHAHPKPAYAVAAASWEAAAEAAKAARKRWVLLNIQDATLFETHLLNLRTWNDESVTDLVKSKFVLWQARVARDCRARARENARELTRGAAPRRGGGQVYREKPDELELSNKMIQKYRMHAAVLPCTIAIDVETGAVRAGAVPQYHRPRPPPPRAARTGGLGVHLAAMHMAQADGRYAYDARGRGGGGRHVRCRGSDCASAADERRPRHR